MTQVNDDFIPLLSPGRYEVCYEFHEGVELFRRPKLVIWFRVLDMGVHFGKRIPRYYNIKRVIGRRGAGARFQAGRSSNFIREYARLFPNRIVRLDRIPMEPFKGARLIVDVRTVVQDREQMDLAPSLHYSVVDRLVEVAQT